MLNEYQRLCLVRLKANKRLKDIYGSPIKVRGWRPFQKDNGVLFMLTVVGGLHSIVIEAADNIEEARLYRWEDGDLIYLDEGDDETLINIIIDYLEKYY